MEEKPLKNGERTGKDLITGKFQKGNTFGEGGPKGERFSLTKVIIKQLEDNPEQLQVIIDWLLANRKVLVWNKIDPNPPSDLNIGGKDGQPIVIQISESIARKNDIDARSKQSS